MSEAAFLDSRLRALSPSDRWRWFTLSCIAAANGGVLPSIEQIAVLAGASPGAVAKWIDRMLEAGLFLHDEDGIFPDQVGPFPVAGEKTGQKKTPLTNAERQRAYRARKKAGEGSAPTTERYEGVTERYEGALPIELELEIKTNRARHARGDRDEIFERFWMTFPEREGENPKFGALVAWRRAIRAGADPEHLIDAARKYANGLGETPKRFICSAARWLSEGRWRNAGAAPGLSKAGAPPAAPGVWVAADSPEGRAWAAFWRATKGKSPPQDAKGGWRFPSARPPIEKEVAA